MGVFVCAWVRGCVFECDSVYVVLCVVHLYMCALVCVVLPVVCVYVCVSVCNVLQCCVLRATSLAAKVVEWRGDPV